MKKLYLGDIRKIPDDSYILVESYEDAVEYVIQNGIPYFISFDHDLGVDKYNNLLPTGYDFAKWIVEMDMDGRYIFPDNFNYIVHSANPVGKENIERYLINYFKQKHTFKK